MNNNDESQKRLTIFKDSCSISLNVNLTPILLIFRMTKESHGIKYLFGELPDRT